MANILKSIVDGASETATSAAKTTAKKAMSTMPNPAEAMYNLGLGIGPLIRNIVDKAREKDKSKGKESATEKTQKKAIENDSKHMTKMTAQLALSNSLLKEIRNLQIKQITALNKQGVVKGMVARGMTTNTKIQGASATAASTMLSKPSEDKKEEMGTGTKLAIGTVGMLAMWKLLPEEMKTAFSNLAGEIIKEVRPVLIDGIGNIIKNSWSNSPFYTTVAGLFIAHVTGVLGFATRMAKAAIATHDFAKNAADKFKQPTGQPAPTTVQPPAATDNLAKAKAEYERLSKYNAKLGRGDARAMQAETVASKYGVTVDQLKAPLPTAPVEPVKPSLGATISKNVSGVIKGAGWVGTALTLGQGAVDYYQAKKDLEDKKISEEEAGARKGGAIGQTTGALAGGTAGAITGGNIGTALGGAIGLMFGGVGAVPGAAIGRLLGTLAGGYFGAKGGAEAGQSIGSTVGSINASKAQSTAQSVVQSASLGGNEQQSLSIIEQVFKSKGFSDIHVRAAQIVAAAESGLNPTIEGDGGDSIGLFQLNRARGEGKPYSVAELKDPFKNATIVAEKMNTEQGAAFRSATTVEEAIAALVRDFEKPSFVKLSNNKPYIADAGAFNQYVGRGAAQLGAKLNASSLAQAASVSGSGITSSSVSSSAASTGAAFAATQQSLDEVLFALSGEKSNINIQQIITAANAAAAKEGGGGPKRSTPSGSDRAASAAQHATGQ